MAQDMVLLVSIYPWLTMQPCLNAESIHGSYKRLDGEKLTPTQPYRDRVTLGL